MRDLLSTRHSPQLWTNAIYGMHFSMRDDCRDRVDTDNLVLRRRFDLYLCGIVCCVCVCGNITKDAGSCSVNNTSSVVIFLMHRRRGEDGGKKKEKKKKEAKKKRETRGGYLLLLIGLKCRGKVLKGGEKGTVECFWGVSWFFGLQAHGFLFCRGYQ